MKKQSLKRAFRVIGQKPIRTEPAGYAWVTFNHPGVMPMVYAPLNAWEVANLRNRGQRLTREVADDAPEVEDVTI